MIEENRPATRKGVSIAMYGETVALVPDFQHNGIGPIWDDADQHEMTRGAALLFRRSKEPHCKTLPEEEPSAGTNHGSMSGLN
jgi:hypothetical protein